MMVYEEYLDEFIFGYLKTSNIINDAGDIQSIKWVNYTVDVQLRDDFDPVTHRENWLSILEGTYRDEEIELDENYGLDFITSDQIFQSMKLLNDSCNVFNQTGGTHSALIHHSDLGYVFAEDIGRFNALDKVVGLALDGGFDLGESLLVTSDGFEGRFCWFSCDVQCLGAYV